MNYTDILKLASKHISSLKGKVMPVVDIAKPPTIEYARHLAKVVSKLSPLVGNMLEFNACVELNKIDWNKLGNWVRQDPGFPDTIFQGSITPAPGMEIKTWFPLATEITARFKDSVKHFDSDQTYVSVVAWLPECILYGKPKIIDVWVGSARSLAIARDKHYHQPPYYIVFEPEDTSSRTSNLQQTNTNGYVFQGSPAQLKAAENEVKAWGPDGKKYSVKADYQRKLKSLLGKFTYRLDTNFAKMDRIEHSGLEAYKASVLNATVCGRKVSKWSELFGDNEKDILKLIQDLI